MFGYITSDSLNVKSNIKLFHLAQSFQKFSQLLHNIVSRPMFKKITTIPEHKRF